MKIATGLFSEKEIERVKEKIKKEQLIIITAHKSPDGDAVGSSLGLFHVLKNAGYQPIVIFPDRFPDFLKWMNGSGQCLFYDQDTEKVNDLFAKAEIVFSLDYNDFSRVGKMKPALENSTAFKIMIDHHPEPSNATDVLFSSTKECSTAQMVYQFVVAMGLENCIDESAAECIYCGIITDTGSFRYASVTAKTHEIVAALFKRGLKNDKVHSNVFDNDPEDRLRLLGYAISEKMKVLPQYQTAYFILTAEELKKFNYKSGFTEGLVNYGLAIQGINMAAIFIEREEEIKISFRSKGNIPVNKFSQAWFNGGGHMNAAGGASKRNLIETESLFLEKLPVFIHEHEN